MYYWLTSMNKKNTAFQISGFQRLVFLIPQQISRMLIISMEMRMILPQVVQLAFKFQMTMKGM